MGMQHELMCKAIITILHYRLSSQEIDSESERESYKDQHKDEQLIWLPAHSTLKDLLLLASIGYRNSALLSLNKDLSEFNHSSS